MGSVDCNAPHRFWLRFGLSSAPHRFGLRFGLSRLQCTAHDSQRGGPVGGRGNCWGNPNGDTECRLRNSCSSSHTFGASRLPGGHLIDRGILAEHASSSVAPIQTVCRNGRVHGDSAGRHVDAITTDHARPSSLVSHRTGSASSCVQCGDSNRRGPITVW